jgi:hypothetical protein
MAISAPQEAVHPLQDAPPCPQAAILGGYGSSVAVGFLLCFPDRAVKREQRLGEQLTAKDRQIAELHVLLQRAMEARPALVLPTPIERQDQDGNRQESRPSWWQRLGRVFTPWPFRDDEEASATQDSVEKARQLHQD